MKLPWFGKQCIVCLKHRPLSLEHVIPYSLGGDLCCDFICKPCNDVFGSTFEARAKTDPAIRLAVANLHQELPAAIYQRIEDGQEWAVQSGPIPGRAIFRAGELVPKPFRHTDGSLMVATKDAPGHIERIARKNGYDAEIVRAASAHLSNIPERKKVELLPGLTIIDWPTDKAEPDLCGSPVDDLVLVKTAFEFLALMAGTAIYSDAPSLNEIRGVLKGSGETGGFRVERLLGPNYGPFHGLYFEGNDPYAKIQVRLFGRLAFRVHFDRLALDGPKIVYTHDLKTGDQGVRQV
jgi:HNH endonuclease